MSSPASELRRLIVLGSTGSIGTSTLEVVRHLGPGWTVAGLAGGRKASLLIEQARQWPQAALAIADPDSGTADMLRKARPGTPLYCGPDASRRLVEETEADMVVAAIVGAAGLPATIAAIEQGMDIALANKETLVAAGELVMPLVRRHGVRLLPVDSEHSAIFQCLQGSAGPDSDRSIKRIVLTASGGPFRTTPLEDIASATVEQALRHPTWNMGPKITIDSATMMNKALEIIEAHWLFGLEGSRISVIIHPQSIAHSFVEFTDHSVLAQLGSPDMKTPIQYALTWPDRAAGCSQPLDWTALSRLDFEQPDLRRYPALSLAYEVIERGGTSGAIVNAANEEAVGAFLSRKIRFGQIVDFCRGALDAIPVRPVEHLTCIETADRQARLWVRDRVG